jgi:3D (Asp-Asp-Asp) domain-containing protein
LIADAEHLLMTAAVCSDDEVALGVGSVAAPTAERFFNGRPLRIAKTITMEVTAYSPDERSCGSHADGTTASGYSVWTNGMKLVAADTNVLPFGSLISVPGYDEGAVVPVLDRGGAIKGNRLDVLYATHEQAQKWGRQTLEVTVWEYADGKGSDFEPRYHRASSVVARR